MLLLGFLLYLFNYVMNRFRVNFGTNFLLQTLIQKIYSMDIFMIICNHQLYIYYAAVLEVVISILNTVTLLVRDFPMEKFAGQQFFQLKILPQSQFCDKYGKKVQSFLVFLYAKLRNSLSNFHLFCIYSCKNSDIIFLMTLQN